MRKTLITFTLSSCFFPFYPGFLQAQETVNKPLDSFSFNASYVGDQVNNLTGGIKSGSCYLGMANLQLAFDVETAGLWNGGLFYLNAANTHGATPSSDLLGDLQVASNIEAGNHTYLQEVWFKQVFGQVALTAGLQDLNVEFANSDNGALYLNSSFGILPVISSNFTAPIFPLTTLGLSVNWTVTPSLSWINAIYDGNPTDFDYNPYNVKWGYHTGDGLLTISELQYATAIKTLPGTYKAGIFTHHHVVDKWIEPSLPDSVNNFLLGMYVYSDQVLWQHGSKTLGVFTQLGYSPSKTSLNNFYIGGGLNATGLFSNQGSDVLGLAVAHENIKDNHVKHETTIELSFQYPLNQQLFIQPDVQYIINPAGTGEKLSNCLAGIIRFGVNL